MASSSCVRKSLLSLNNWSHHNNGGNTPSPLPPGKERSNSNTSCKTTSALALATSNMVDFWNRVSQQMAYIDGSTRSPSLIDGGSTRSSLPNECTRDSLLVAIDTTTRDNRSGSLLDEQNPSEIEDERSASILDDGNSQSVSLIDQRSASIYEDVITPLRGETSKPKRQSDVTSPVSQKSCSGSRHTATTFPLEPSPPVSPRVHKAQRPINPRAKPHRQTSTSEDDETRSRHKPWYRKPSSRDKRKHINCETNDTSEDQSAIWHHVFTEVGSKGPSKADERSGTCYRNYFNDDDEDCYYDDDFAKDGMELELLQPAADVPEKVKPSVATAVIPSSATSTSVVMETASIGGGRISTRTRLHKYQQQFSFCAGDRRLSVRIYIILRVLKYSILYSRIQEVISPKSLKVIFSKINLQTYWIMALLTGLEISCRNTCVSLDCGYKPPNK